MHVFDRALLRLRRDRAAGRLHAHGFLLGELAARLTDRLLDFKRRFPRALDLGCHTGELGRALGGTGAVDLMFQADPSAAMARQAGALAVSAEEDALPFGFATLDLVVSAWSLHWVNDLPGALVQIRRALKPDGLFLAALAGSGTLGELRESLIEAELDSERGAGPRVSPFMDGRELAALLERAGFALPVVDVDRITVTYADAFALMRDLRGMGESNALLEQRRGFSRPATLARAAALYRARHGDGEGRLPATFEILFATAWAPHQSQQRPLAPGSARHRLAAALDAEEVSTGVRARPR